MTSPEFSRPVDVRQSDRKHMRLDASESECAALSRRFALVRIDRLEADLDLAVDRESNVVSVTGRFSANIVQSCAVSGEDLPVAVDEPIVLRFVPAATMNTTEEELEIDSAEVDEIEYDGSLFDLGEAVAQSLALAIDPFATGPQAEEARRKAGLSDASLSGPFAALAALKPKK